ncbi:MAG: hypothetical protein PHV06_09730 [bacterium]|nr:hypothetical protein [bacterium]
MKRLVFLFLFLGMISMSTVQAYEMPPTFALINLNIGTINPVGFWKDAFTTAPYFSLSIQYPAKVMNLYLGGKVDFTTMNGEEFRDVYFQLFSVYGYASYNLVEFQDFSMYVNGGLGINFQEIEFGDGKDEAILGGLKFDVGFRKQAAKNLFLNLNINYTYIPDTPFLNIGVGISYSFGNLPE